MKKIELNEKAMQTLELQIPQLASAAISQAYARALTTSGKVVEARDGRLVETYADGSEKFIRNLAKPIPVVAGTTRVRKVNP